MKMNLPGVHGGISQQSPHLRLQNQHTDATNVVFDVLDGVRTRWGTKFVGTPDRDMTSVIGDIETTDGKHWLISWTGTQFNFMNLEDTSDNYWVTPSGSYMPTVHTDIRMLPILDTAIVLNTKKTITFTKETLVSNAKMALMVVPQTPEGLAYDLTMVATATKTGTSPVGTILWSASCDGTVAAGATPTTFLEDVDAAITGNDMVGVAIVNSNILCLYLKTAALDMEPTIVITSNSEFDLPVFNAKIAPKVSPSDSAYYVCTTPSYEKLPNSHVPNVTFEISEGYYVAMDPNSNSYIECAAPGLGGVLDKTTMPHELRYNLSMLPGNPWSFNPVDAYDSWGRQVGDKTSAPLPNFVGRTINNVFFYRNRLGILSDNYVALSAVGKFYNWFPETATEVTDSDPIVVFPTSIRFSELLWAVPFGKQLVLLSASKQYILHSGYDALTPQTIAVDEATNYKLLPLVEPLLLEASLVLAIDHGDYAGIIEYRVDDQQVVTEGSLLSSVVPQLIPSTITHMIYMPAEHMVLIHQRGETTVYVYKFNKREDGQLTQMAWAKWELAEEGVFAMVRRSGTRLIILAGDALVTELDTAAPKTSITMDNQRTLTVGHGYTLPSGTTTAVVATTGKELEIDTTNNTIIDTSGAPVTVVFGTPIEWSLTLSPLVLRDDNGLPRADLDATIENTTIDWEGGAYRFTVSGQGLPTRTKEMTPEATTLVDVAAGTSLTEVTPTRFLVMAPSRRVTLTLSGDAYFPVRINNISYNLYVTKDRG
jgi:hypothetical protein